MPSASAFSPYRLAPGAAPLEGAFNAKLEGAGPLVNLAGQPLPPELLTESFVGIEAGLASGEGATCRSADGGLAGAPGARLACLSAEPHRRALAAAAATALQDGHAGAVFLRPDAPLAEGLLAAGFCPVCQRELQQRLARKYGEQFQPIDLLAMAREAVAGASGAVDLADLPFGHDFWRFRHESLERSVRAQVRAARDAARAADRPFPLCGWFAALGPSQLAAARHLDAAVFPAPLTGVALPGRFELLRGALLRRSLAVELPADAPAAAWLRVASLAAPWGIGLAGVQPGGEVGAVLAGIRALMRGVAARGGAPSDTTVLRECAVLYSAEADLWSGGRHRHAVETAITALLERQLQASVAFHPAEVPITTPLVLADASPLSRLEQRELEKRRAGGGTVIGFDGPDQDPRYEKAVDAHFPPERRLVEVTAPVTVLASLRGWGEAVDVHLATSWPERASRPRVRLSVLAVRGARKGRFRSADGAEARVRFSRAGDGVTADLPTFTGYAVLSPET